MDINYPSLPLDYSPAQRIFNVGVKSMTGLVFTLGTVFAVVAIVGIITILFGIGIGKIEV